MSYKVSTNNGSMYHKWFYEAWVAVNAVNNENKGFHDVYINHYGYKVDQYVDHVIFPSEEEATMFMLRWS